MTHMSTTTAARLRTANNQHAIAVAERVIEAISHHLGYDPDMHDGTPIDLINYIAPSARPGFRETVQRAVEIGLLVPVDGSVGLYEATVSDWRDLPRA